MLLYVKGGFYAEKSTKRGVFSKLNEIFTPHKLFPKKKSLSLHCCLYLHFFTVFRILSL